MALEKPKPPYDRVILLIISLLAIAVCGLLVLSALKFPETFRIAEPVKSTEVEDPGFEELKQATTALTAKSDWASPVVKGKPVPLSVSVPLVQKGSEIYDMYLDDNLLRPPVKNTWLLENRLPYERDDVLDLDTDRDGFSNLEEWEAKTSPSDARQHPDYVTKLALVEVKSFPVSVLFRDGGDSDFQVTVTNADKTKSNAFMSPAFNEAESKFGAFRDDKKQKRFQGIGYTPGSPAKLKIRDLQRNEEFEVTRGQEDLGRTDYDGVFEFRMMGYGPELKQARLGDVLEFNLPGNVRLQYKLVDINAAKGSIQPLNEQGQPAGPVVETPLKR